MGSKGPVLPLRLSELVIIITITACIFMALILYYTIIYSFCKPLFQWFSEFGKPPNFLEGLLKHRSLGLPPSFLFSRSEVDLRICSSDKLLLEAVTSSVLVTVGRPNPCHQQGIS